MGMNLSSRNQLINRDQLIEVYGSYEIPSSHSQSSRPPSDSPFSVPKCIHKVRDWLDIYFKLYERNSNIDRWCTELKAAFADYVTMAYILAVNASILTQTGGTCLVLDTTDSHEDTSVCSISAYSLNNCLRNLRLNLITATAASTCISTFIMGWLANQPFALAPGMGMNAYFVYTVVGTYSSKKNLNYEAALFAIFCEGWIFLILSCVGVSSCVGKWLPLHFKASITAGIGLFLARIGFEKDQGIGLISDNEITIQSDTILGIIGVIIMMILYIFKIRGSMLITIIIMTIISLSYCDEWHEFSWKSIFRVPQWHFFAQLSQRMFSFQYGFEPIATFAWIEAASTFLLVDVLDTTGALYGLADYAKILEDKKDFEKSIKRAYCADAIGTIIGSICGTSPVTTFIESSSGIHQGGRTGITAILVSIFFGISMFLGPIFASIPRYATGPCLIIIGVINLKYYIGNINWSSLRIAFPSGLTIIVMPFSKSITYGIIAGCIAHLVIKIVDFFIWLIWKRCGPFPCKCCQYKKDNKNGKDLSSNSSNLTDHEIIYLFKTRILGMAPDNSIYSILNINKIKKDVQLMQKESDLSFDTNGIKSELKHDIDDTTTTMTEKTTSIAMTKTKSSVQPGSFRIN